MHVSALACALRHTARPVHVLAGDKGDEEEPEIICLVVFIICDNVWSAGLNGGMNHLISHYPV